jgi:hypothetical protein
MRRSVLALICLLLSVSCPGSRQSNTVEVPTRTAEFSGVWNVQLVAVEDRCGGCTPGIPIDQEGLTIGQVQDTVTVSLTGKFLRAVGSGSVTGSTMTVAFGPDIYQSDWYFLNSRADMSCSLSGDRINGAIFLTLGELGPCCGLCCAMGQCLCGSRTCRVALPSCTTSLTFSAVRIPS